VNPKITGECTSFNISKNGSVIRTIPAIRLQQIKPDVEDYAAVERDFGVLPKTASDVERAHHYRLAQSTKLLRLYPQGKFPPDKDARNL